MAIGWWRPTSRREVPANKRSACTSATCWFRSRAFRIGRAIEATEVLATLGAWRRPSTRFVARRESRAVPANVIIGEAERDSTIFYQYAVGRVYLAIGLFVYFRRRQRAAGAAFLPAVPGVLRSVDVPLYRQAEQFRQGDLSGQRGGGVSWRPRCSCTSASSFRSRRSGFGGAARRCWCICPGWRCWRSISGVVFGWLRTAAPLLEVRWLLDRVWLMFLCAMYLAGGCVLAFQLRHADDPDRAPAVDLAAQRRAGRHSAVRADLRRAVPDGRARRITR